MHGVGEVYQPGIRASLFHVPGDFQHSINVAGGMRESPGSAVFAVWLAQPILQGQLEVLPPQSFARLHFDRADDIIRAGEGVFVVGMRADPLAAIPTFV